MNRELLLATLKEKTQVRKKILEKDSSNAKEFSSISYFAGEEYNQELAQNQELQAKIKDNIIDFNQLGNKEGDFLEKKITEIYNNSQNQQLIEKGNYPII